MEKKMQQEEEDLALSQQLEIEDLFQKVKKKNQENIDRDLALELEQQQYQNIKISKQQQKKSIKKEEEKLNDKYSDNSYDYGTNSYPDDSDSDSSDDENSCIIDKIFYQQDEAYKYERDEIPSGLKMKSAAKYKTKEKKKSFLTQKKDRRLIYKISYQVGGVYDANNFVFLSQNLGSCHICRKKENRNILIRQVKPEGKYEIFVVCPEGCKGNIKKLQRTLVQELLDYPNIVKDFGKKCITYLLTREY